MKLNSQKSIPAIAFYTIASIKLSNYEMLRYQKWQDSLPGKELDYNSHAIIESLTKKNEDLLLKVKQLQSSADSLESKNKGLSNNFEIEKRRFREQYKEELKKEAQTEFFSRIFELQDGQIKFENEIKLLNEQKVALDRKVEGLNEVIKQKDIESSQKLLETVKETCLKYNKVEKDRENLYNSQTNNLKTSYETIWLHVFLKTNDFTFHYSLQC